MDLCGQFMVRGEAVYASRGVARQFPAILSVPDDEHVKLVFSISRHPSIVTEQVDKNRTHAAMMLAISQSPSTVQEFRHYESTFTVLLEWMRRLTATPVIILFAPLPAHHRHQQASPLPLSSNAVINACPLQNKWIPLLAKLHHY